MKENKNLSAPKQGMDRETHISQLKNTDYTFMMNGNTDSQIGESVSVTNEPSNNLAVAFSGYKVIHYKKDVLNNRTYYFLTNTDPDSIHYKKSSIGYVEDTIIEGYNEDIYQECVDCSKNSNILGTPLEGLQTQPPTHNYVKIIDDECLPIGEGFNFDINYPIKFSELKQEKGVTNIYWNDKLNKPRWMCLSDVSYLFLQEQVCGDPVVLSCMQPYKLLQFPEHSRIIIEPETVQTGGTLKMGAYEFYAAYSNLYGDEATNYSTPTNPISIWDENNNILSDETTDSFTNFAIRLKVSNLDTRFPYYKVVCVETNNVSRTKSAFIAGIYPTTDDTILYNSSGSTNDDYIVTGNSSLKRRVDLYELARVRPDYEFATGDVQSGGRKFMWGLKTKSEINLQPVVNLFGSLLKWQSNIAKESLYKTAIATSKYKGWMRNEVQPFAIRFLYKDGGYSAAFPLVARPATSYDKDDVNITDTNYLSILEDAPTCTTTDRTKRWQLFNTATLDSLCQSNLAEGTVITESLDKRCTIEEAKTITSNSITIPVEEGTTYNGLKDYIESNLPYITNSGSGAIYDNLGKYFLINEDGIAEYVDGTCTPAFGTISTSGSLIVGESYLINTLLGGDNFANVGFITLGQKFTATGTEPNLWTSSTEVIKTNCNYPILNREEVILNSIQGNGEGGKEVSSFNYKNLEEYQKSLPVNFCTVYKTSLESAAPIRDLEFEKNYMGCDSAAAVKQVFFRDINFQNESCNYAVNIVNNNIPTQVGVGYHHNYYGAALEEDIEQTYNAVKKAATSSVNFRPNLHKGALFFKISKLNREKLIFEITKNSISTTNDDNDDISDNVTPKQLRYTFYDACDATTALSASTVVDTTVGDIIELDVLALEAAAGKTLNTFYVAIDAPYVSELVPDTEGDCGGDKTEKFRTAPPTGCFSVYTRDLEAVSVTSTWNSIKLDKVQTYTADCDFTIPKVQECKPIPYARGKFSYWESTETYSKNKELYDSSSLKIAPTDLQGLTTEDKALFKEYFVDSTVVSGTYTLKPETNLSCNIAGDGESPSNAIRHFKFPDNNISPFISDMNVTDNSETLIFPLGVYLDPAVVRTMLQVALNNNLITYKQLSNIEGYEILKGDNSIHKSIIANGLAYDMYKYEQKGKDYFYANYPHNDLGKDLLHYVSKDNKTLIQHPFGGTSNNKYSFLSPDLFLNRITIPTEMVLSGYQVGTSTTTFQDVEDHPKWTLLGSKARKTAEKLALLESILELAIKAASAAETFRVDGGFVWSFNIPGAILGAAVAAAAIAAEVMSYGKYRYEWLKIFDDLGTAYNFASYGVSHGYHNKFIKNTQEGDYLRALPLRKYMRDGRYTYRDESTGEEIFVNNFQREHSIFLSTGKYGFNYPPEYFNYDNNTSSTLTTSRTTLGLNGCTSEEEIKGTVGSPYISLKNYIPDQFGIIDSVKWLTTGYSEKLEKEDSCNIIILGGNVCISRFTWKRKIPMFKKNIVGTADKIPFNYGDYKNIGSPVYFCNYKSDSEEDLLGVPFPDINSELNFDSCGEYKNRFYIRPPAKMYLFYYGIADFLVESEINCNFRYAQNSDKEFFYPQAGDIVDWTQEKNVPIKEPNRFFYNNTYSQQVSNTPYRVLDKGFSKEEWERRSIQDNAVIYSEMDNSENDISDPWLTYKPLNWYEFSTKYGKLIQLKGVESDSLLGRFENQMVKFNSLDKLQTSSGASIELGSGGIFASRPLEYQTTDLGYSGTQHSDMVSTPYGNFFVDAKRGQVFQRTGDEIVAISDRTGQQPSGLKNWFREQLPFKILKKFPEVDIDNKYKGIGISMGWDSRMERVFLTKKDYIPVNDPCLQYSRELGFYTDCSGEEVTCPTGYTYNTETQLCEKMVESDKLCPEGYVYNELTNTCTLVETVEAYCTCTADVIAADSSICSGSNISINLSTTSSEDISYNWVVVQDGVTGATAGSGNVINQVLTTSGLVNGTATYTVTPHEVVSGCIGTPILVVITVKPIPNVIATPSSLSITEGETANIVLTSDNIGTTFTWTAVNSGTTGGTNGSGNTISQAIVGVGTTAYTITPTLEGCVGAPIDVVVTVTASAGISCGGSVAASGGGGYYEVPAVVGTDTGEVIVTLDAANIPDRFQIIWDGNVVADSLFIGDALPNAGYESNIITATSLNKFLYNGSTFDANGTISVDYSASDIANSTGTVGTLRSSGSVGGQIGVVANYPTPTSKASEGNIKLSFTKTTALPVDITIVAIGTETSTGWYITSLECPVT